MKGKAEDKEPLRVKILDTEYRLKRGEEPDSYYEKIAKYVDQKMRGIVEKSSRISVDKIAVLAALRICEELFQLRDESEENEKLLRQKLDELSEMLQSSIR